MANYNSITIGGKIFRRPDNFAPMREDVYASEYTTMTGDVKADKIGWKYADMELKWSALPDSQARALLTQLNGEFTITIDDPENTEYINEPARRISVIAMRHKYYDPNYFTYWWKDVSVKISFLKTHTD